MRNLTLHFRGLQPLYFFPDTSQDVVCFQTTHRIGTSTKRGYTEQLMIPFDRYSLRIFAAAIDPATNRSVHIVQFAVASPLGSFVILSHDVDASQPTYIPGNGPFTPHPGSHMLNAEIRRSAIAQTFMISLALINWLLTIGSVYITVLVMSGKMEADHPVAALPFSMMLTIPAVRAIYAEPPSLSTSLGTFCIYRPMFFPFDSLHLQIQRVSSCRF